jgi:hypothetical protein
LGGRVLDDAAEMQFLLPMRPHVTTSSSCDPLQGGWYYDVDPAAGTPTKVILCSLSCTAVKADAAGQIDVVQGCQTIVF